VKNIIIAIIMAALSSFIMVYLTIVTPLGPWIGPVLALCVVSLYKCGSSHCALPVASGSIAGIIATAYGFSFPTFFFLDQTHFKIFMHNPYTAFFLMGAAILSLGFFGLVWAWVCANYFLHSAEYNFPIGQVIHTLLTTQEWVVKRMYLLMGACVAISYHVTHYVLGIFGVLRFSACLPLLMSLGFVAGAAIAIPLVVGMVLQCLVIPVMHSSMFSYVSRHDFIFGFASGLVLSTFVAGLAEKFWTLKGSPFIFFKRTAMVQCVTYKDLLWIVGALVGVISFFSYVGYPWYLQCYLIGSIVVATYSVVAIAGKVGMALLGRFATFVMAPALFFFKRDPFLIMLIALSVEIVSGVAVDALFSYKVGQLSGIKRNKIFYYQLLGLCVAAVAITGAVWFLIQRAELGSELLFAQRAQARALLIKAVAFDVQAVLCGVVVGYCLKRFKMHSLFVLSGVLMPLSLSIPLVMGSIIAFNEHQKKKYEMFACGIYAMSTVYIFLSLL